MFRLTPRPACTMAKVARLSTDGEKVTGEERLLTDIGARIRDVRQGPDGFLYLLTDEDDGKVLRVKPAG